MRLMTEKRAENFLSKEGFEIIEGVFVGSKKRIKSALNKVGLPCVMKVSGDKIIHKGILGGVKINIQTYSEAIHEFLALKKIKGAQGVLFQKTFSGKEFILGVKKNEDFSHIIVFGKGGSEVEKKRDVSFRVCPLEDRDISKMLKETKIGKKLSKSVKESLKKNIFLLCKLIKKYPQILELDINPFVISRKEGKVVDARIVLS
jgi:acetate---CoA ligase (ADP-forming)